MGGDVLALVFEPPVDHFLVVALLHMPLNVMNSCWTRASSCLIKKNEEENSNQFQDKQTSEETV